MSEYTFEADDDTIAFFDVVCWCLVRYFGHKTHSAKEAVNAFVNALDGPESVEWLHHDGPFWAALRVHHFVDLRGNWDDFTQWRVAEGYTSPPEEVHEYMRQHYFKQPKDQKGSSDGD